MQRFTFVVTETFIEDLDALEENVQIQIKAKIKSISQESNPFYFSKKLQGKKDVFRFRCGDYRMVFRLERNVIILLKVKHRKDIYKGL